MEKEVNIIGIIPARGDSKGIAHKNIKLFNGKPLIYYAVKLAKEVEKKGIITGYIISTDDTEIASIAKDFGGNVPFLRPRELATDDSPVVDTIIHAVDWWEKHHKELIHSVLTLQPTNPLTSEEDIDKAVSYYLDKQPKARCLISVCDAQHVRLPTLYYKNSEYLEQVLSKVNPVVARQALRKLYWRNGAVYITRRDLLLQSKIVIDNKPLFYEMPRFRSVAIDDLFDWAVAELLMDYQGK